MGCWWVLIGFSRSMFYNLRFTSSFIKISFNFTNRVCGIIRSNKLINNIEQTEKVAEFCLWHYRRTPFSWRNSLTSGNSRLTFKSIRFQLTEILYPHIWKAKLSNYWNNTLILTILSLLVPFCAVKRDLFMTDFADGKSLDDTIFLKMLLFLINEIQFDQRLKLTISQHVSQWWAHVN